MEKGIVYIFFFVIKRGYRKRFQFDVFFNPREKETILHQAINCFSFLNI